MPRKKRELKVITEKIPFFENTDSDEKTEYDLQVNVCTVPLPQQNNVRQSVKYCEKIRKLPATEKQPASELQEVEDCMVLDESLPFVQELLRCDMLPVLYGVDKFFNDLENVANAAIEAFTNFYKNEPFEYGNCLQQNMSTTVGYTAATDTPANIENDCWENNAVNEFNFDDGFKNPYFRTVNPKLKLKYGSLNPYLSGNNNTHAAFLAMDSSSDDKFRTDGCTLKTPDRNKTGFIGGLRL